MESPVFPVKSHDIPLNSIKSPFFLDASHKIYPENPIKYNPIKSAINHRTLWLTPASIDCQSPWGAIDGSYRPRKKTGTQALEVLHDPDIIYPNNNWIVQYAWHNTTQHNRIEHYIT